ncbi:hypothetical protein MMC21_008375 [Puttea exsequens]|nr:hypothetical protein [Puttea exsequens]
MSESQLRDYLVNREKHSQHLKHARKASDQAQKAPPISKSAGRGQFPASPRRSSPELSVQVSAPLRQVSPHAQQATLAPLSALQNQAFQVPHKAHNVSQMLPLPPPAPPPDTAEDTGSSLKVLRLIPHNNKAKLAFSSLVKNKLKLNDHHIQYIVPTQKGYLFEGAAFNARPDDETTDDEAGDKLTQQEVQLGYFGINFGSQRVASGVKWSMGRGSEKRFGPRRNVDVLLALPGTADSRSLFAAHAILKLHPDSGAWMLAAGQGIDDPMPTTENPVVVGERLKEAPFVIDDVQVWPGQPYCLSKPESRLEIAGMQFLVNFAIHGEANERIYCDLRDKILEEQGLAPLSTRMTGIPSAYDTHVPNLIVFRTGLGAGGFGMVSEGFHPRTGDIRVAKEIIVKHHGYVPVVQTELDAHKDFADETGLVRSYGWINQNGTATLAAKYYPLRVYLILEKGVDFFRFPWRSESSVNWMVKKQLFRQLVDGLTTIHRAGGMHRDINTANILYFPSEQRAALCDYGKLCMTRTHTDTQIANWDFLPPEIVEGQQYVYNQKIDIWMLGFALISAWFPNVIARATRDIDNNRIVPRYNKHHDALRYWLGKEVESGLSGILTWMMTWDSFHRPSVESLLISPIFKAIQQELQRVAEGKRVQQAPPETVKEGKRPQQ